MPRISEDFATANSASAIPNVDSEILKSEMASDFCFRYTNSSTVRVIK